MNSKELRNFLQKVYCRVDYDLLKKLYDYPSDAYLKEKWKKFKANWSNWYCSLDDNHATKFIELIENA